MWLKWINLNLEILNLENFILMEDDILERRCAQDDPLYLVAEAPIFKFVQISNAIPKDSTSSRRKVYARSAK